MAIDELTLVDEWRVRRWNLLFAPGPPRRQDLTRFFGIGWAHIGWLCLIDGELTVIEFGLKGCRSRPLVDYIRFFGEVEVARVPMSEHLNAQIDAQALHALTKPTEYAGDLTRLAYAWANFRSIDHAAIRRWARCLFPIVALASAWLGRRRENCSTFVYRLLDEAGVTNHMCLRLDVTLPTNNRRARRAHRLWASRACTPSDFWCCSSLDQRQILTRDRLPPEIA